LLRDGRKQSLQLKLAERPRDQGISDPLPTRRRGAPVEEGFLLGLNVRDLDVAFARRMDVPASIDQGVVVVRVDPAGAAFSPPMRRGFVITEINRRPVRSVADFERIARAARGGDALAFYGYDPSVGQRSLVLATVDTR
jgi:serine protease Do